MPDALGRGVTRIANHGAELQVLMRLVRILFQLIVLVGIAASPLHAQSATADVCARPKVGGTVAEPADLRSVNGELRVRFFFRSEVDAAGLVRYCYVTENGEESPTLRVRPGDSLVISLKNEMIEQKPATAAMNHGVSANTCAGGGVMNPTATNLHFHGLAIPPKCHQDEVLTTSVLAGDSPYEYRVQIPTNQPPGLYWYHPHLHGFSKAQVLGGASGALIVEGIERANPALAGLPERVIIIRDKDLMNPNAAPAQTDPDAPRVILDPDGDARNTGSGTGKPAKDLSVNFVPVPFPNYERAIIQIKPGEKQLWRALNASAITYLNLQMVWDGQPQDFAVVAMDGVPFNTNGLGRGMIFQNHVGLPPGGRAEFVITGPAEGVKAELLTRSVNTGSGGENDPVRPIASIVASNTAPELRTKLSPAPEPLLRSNIAWLGDVQPAHERRLYFTEKLQDPNDPNSPTTFYITVEGQQPVAFDPNSAVPNIVVHQGDVEDWFIENRTQELHAFHIHQIHFMLTEWFGIAVNEPFLRDVINVPFWDGKTKKYPSVKLRMDFRDPSIIGTFPYHCHLLEHEDGGMMGLVRVDPPEVSKKVHETVPSGSTNLVASHP
jgi:FtsP/CotA-like multicopper oxidase with cupredoxin domain